VTQKLASAQTQHGKKMKELCQRLEEDKKGLRQQLEREEQSSKALEQKYNYLRLNEENTIKQLREEIAALRLQPPPVPVPLPVPVLPSVPQLVQPPGYGISVHYRDDSATADNTLTLMESTGIGSWWVGIPDGQKLTMTSSGTSGLLRFRLSNGEQIAVTVGVHNYLRWCDITDLKADEALASRQWSYYTASDPGFAMLWKQASSWSMRTPRRKAVTVYYTVADGSELHAIVRSY
jgi:hypothetical protein